MNELRRGHARASLSAFRSAAMAQAADHNARHDWIRDNSTMAGW